MTEMTMTPRLNPFAAAPQPMKAWLEYGQSVSKLGLEASLMELVKIRASQINGCAFCLDMHAAAARKAGETEQRLYLLDAWRDSPLYSERERAALAWTEALTWLADKGAPDEVYQALKAHFSDEEQVALSLLIVTINGWNRIQVGFRAVHPVEGQRAA
jgi:AhpD family alkylhydroperoxidase